MKDEKCKRRGLKGFLNANDFHGAIETYRRRVEDLKSDFLVLPTFFMQDGDLTILIIIVVDPCNWQLFTNAARFDCATREEWNSASR